MAIPFPFVLAEIFLFFYGMSEFGFLPTLAFYFLPCLLGILILQIWGRVTMLQLRATTARGEQPGPKLIHAGAIFISGICFLIPSILARLVGIALLLPGTRHFLIWKLKGRVLENMSRGNAGFNFGGFAFRAGASPFGGQNPFQRPPERNVSPDILDIQPIEVSHTTTEKKD
jgi:UPF0716 protein FxsA